MLSHSKLRLRYFLPPYLCRLLVKNNFINIITRSFFLQILTAIPYRNHKSHFSFGSRNTYHSSPSIAIFFPYFSMSPVAYRISHFSPNNTSATLQLCGLAIAILHIASRTSVTHRNHKSHPITFHISLPLPNNTSVAPPALRYFISHFYPPIAIPPSQFSKPPSPKHF